MARLITIPEGRWFPGADTVFEIEVLDADGDPQEMGSWELLWAVNNGRENVLSMETGGNGITITSNGTDPNTNSVAEIAIARDDTVDLPSGKYMVALWRTDDDNDVPLAYGTAILTPVVAQPAEPAAP